MSELINSKRNNANFQRGLMATASALALTAYIASINDVLAKDGDRPTVWIELGGQMELLQGLDDPTVAPFMTAISPTPGPYSGNIFLAGQKPTHHAFGLEGSVTFQPEDSDWVFTAGIRYGRSHSNRHIHHQTQVQNVPYPVVYTSFTAFINFPAYAAPFADIKSKSAESHAIIDFSAGRDVGIGILGSNGSSTISAGVRYAQFSSRSSIAITARPLLVPHYNPFFFGGKVPKYTTWDQYSLNSQAERSFHGIGPSLSWSGSAALIGNKDGGELTLDMSVNGALLFGRQRATTSHNTQQRHYYGQLASPPVYPVIYQTGTGIVRSRSRTVVVPNLGGAIGFSVKYPNAKVSLGYRSDFFFGATDGGIDDRHAKNLGFNGPFATLSIGLGD